MMTNARMSIRQVAERAGVSAMTVSRVMRGSSAPIRPETRERVVAAINELEYVPVPHFAQNREVRTHVLGFVPYSITPFELVETETNMGITRAAYEADYDILWILRKERDWAVNRPHASFLDRRADAYIFSSKIQGEWTEALQAIVKAGIKATVCYSSEVPEGIAWVGVDNERVTDAAVEHLHALGHRKICYVGGPMIYADDPVRLPEYRPARCLDDYLRQAHAARVWKRLTGSGEGFQVIDVTLPETRLDEKLPQTIIDRGITGAVFFNDLSAMKFMRLAATQGIIFPADLSIVSIDNLKSSQDYGLTSVDYGGFQAIGAAAVQASIDMLNGKTAAAASRKLFAGLIQRASAAAPRSTGTR